MERPSCPTDQQPLEGPTTTASSAPPPSYRETVNPLPTSQHLGLLPPSQPGNVQRFPDPRGPHLLHIHHDSSHRTPNLTILASDKTTILYTVTANTASPSASKPHMLVYRCHADQQTSSTPVGTIFFRPPPQPRTIDLTLHGREVVFEREGFLGRTHGFDSPGIGRLRWEREGFGGGGGLKMVNGRGEWVARYDGGKRVGEKGVLEIVSWEIGGASLDEIVVSGVAVSEGMRRRWKG